MAEFIRAYLGEYPKEDLDLAQQIRERLGGEGEVLDLEDIVDAWAAFSGSLHCSGHLILSDHTMENFTGWLLGRWIRLERLAASLGPPQTLYPGLGARPVGKER